ncbi:predicted protein [Methanosarcina acetivorans C2A]|uniref:Uncharacterized protein n=1 Tax=Methanosarcina acetivorans (strain ATCC 35395 / DSM 2834 / JCM 12185 / C2A) TaxID=188937 RepID=Q8TI68_METAC|nr:predicted protein [Methanosarcina acetivorans C2A]
MNYLEPIRKVDNGMLQRLREGYTIWVPFRLLIAQCKSYSKLQHFSDRFLVVESSGDLTDNDSISKSGKMPNMKNTARTKIRPLSKNASILVKIFDEGHT